MSGNHSQFSADHHQPRFADRHIGPDSDAVATMLKVIGVDSLASLAEKALPAGILDALTVEGLAPGLDQLPPPATEEHALADLRDMADANTVAVSMIGQGYFDTLTPPVLRRNIIENPAWYTAYTPYQPEISQGRLEALLNFQTMVEDLTGLEVANASMLDEGTAAAEAMTLMHRAVKGSANRLAVDVDLYRQTAAILATRAEPLGIEIVTADLRNGLPEGEFFGVVVSLPGASGVVNDWSDLIASAHERGALVAVGADLLARPSSHLPVTSAPTSRSAPPNASACRWASADRTPDTSPCTPSTPVSCPAAWSACRSTPTGRRPTAWRCRPASSTSGVTRRPATSAPRRSCSR